MVFKYEVFIDKVLQNVADELLDFASKYLEQYEAIDTGELLNSLKVVKTEVGYNVVADAPHSIYVEYGRSPGAANPPLEPLIGWIKRNNIDTSNVKVPISLMKWMDNVGLTTPSASGKPIAQHKLVAKAFYLMKSIAKYGIEQRPFLRSAIEETKANIDKIIEKTKNEVGVIG
jgi:hypothetical protein